MKQTRLLLLFVMMGLFGPGAKQAIAAHVTVPITTSAMTSTTANSRPVFVLSLDVPSVLDGKRLDSVLLKFYVDAALVSGETVEHAPTIDVRALTAPYSSNSAITSSAALGRAHPVPVGDDRKIVVDITDIVKAWIADPSSNHGLVIGSLGGSQAGDFTMRNNMLGASSRVAAATFFYQNRSGGRISSRGR